MSVFKFETAEGVFTIDQAHDSKYAQTFKPGCFPEAESKVLDMIYECVTTSSRVIDVGANIGLISIPVSKKVKTVYSFEPIPKNINYLETNIEANNRTNIVVYPFALSDKSGTLNFYEEVSGQASTYRWDDTKGDVLDVRTLDSFNLSCDFIKIDVQGLESLVIKGAKNTIASSQPYLLFEVSTNIFEVPDRFKIIRDTLQDYSFYLDVNGNLGRFSSFWLTCFLIMPGAFIFRKKGSHFDVLAVPKSKASSIDAHSPVITLLLLIKKLFFRHINKLHFSARKAGRY